MLNPVENLHNYFKTFSAAQMKDRLNAEHGVVVLPSLRDKSATQKWGSLPATIKSCNTTNTSASGSGQSALAPNMKSSKLFQQIHHLYSVVVITHTNNKTGQTCNFCSTTILCFAYLTNMAKWSKFYCIWVGSGLGLELSPGQLSAKHIIFLHFSK